MRAASWRVTCVLRDPTGRHACPPVSRDQTTWPCCCPRRSVAPVQVSLTSLPSTPIIRATPPFSAQSDHPLYSSFPPPCAADVQHYCTAFATGKTPAPLSTTRNAVRVFASLRLAQQPLSPPYPYWHSSSTTLLLYRPYNTLFCSSRHPDAHCDRDERCCVFTHLYHLHQRICDHALQYSAEAERGAVHPERVCCHCHFHLAHRPRRYHRSSQPVD